MIASELIGRRLEELDTPILVVELDRLERNIARCRELVAGASLTYRPHGKTHKSPVVARMQILAGAVGLCCAKLAEAEVMGAAGVPDILVTTEVIGTSKIRRLMSLARGMRASGGCVAVVADDAANIDALAEAASNSGLELPVHIDVDVGMHRTGAPPGKPAVDLALRVVRAPGLRFAGFQGYHGLIQMKQSFGEREAETRAALEPLLDTGEQARKIGLDVPVLTGGGTGTAIFDAGLGGLTELQPGSYVFMDSRYAAIEWTQSGEKPPFENALSIIGTVVSRPTRERATIDIGLKASSTDAGLAHPIGLEGVTMRSGGDEHGILEFDGICPLSVGDRVTLIPSHCDTTINLYDHYVCARDRTVEAVWPIAARGRVQ